MWLLGLYRFYLSVISSVLFYIFAVKSVLLSIFCFILFRGFWFVVEKYIGRMTVKRNFKKHIADFKQQLGPYGIRLANKAENDWTVMVNLAEIFTQNQNKLKKTIEQLEMMDTLFKAGMRPDQDALLLHDLKLKYGKIRLENMQKAS